MEEPEDCTEHPKKRKQDATSSDNSQDRGGETIEDKNVILERWAEHFG